jgi:hypothetical protein
MAFLHMYSAIPLSSLHECKPGYGVDLPQHLSALGRNLRSQIDGGYCVHEIDRSALEEVSAGVEGHLHRNAAIHKVCLEFGYAQAHVATAKALYCSMISKIIRKME